MSNCEKSVCVAGGCFWGTQRVFKMLNGVIKTWTGYANGRTENPVYEEVKKGQTGFKEAVMIRYNPEVLSLEKILKALFICIDPAVKNGQGEDHGTQYQTGVYYTDDADLPVIQAYFDTERPKHQAFYTELEKLDNFYSAEEYHQDYLDKHPDGYCHISILEAKKVQALNDE